jgi:hypothetical protein
MSWAPYTRHPAAVAFLRSPLQHRLVVQIRQKAHGADPSWWHSKLALDIADRQGMKHGERVGPVKDNCTSQPAQHGPQFTMNISIPQTNRVVIPCVFVRTYLLRGVHAVLIRNSTLHFSINIATAPPTGGYSVTLQTEVSVLSSNDVCPGSEKSSMYAAVFGARSRLEINNIQHDDCARRGHES